MSHEQDTSLQRNSYSQLFFIRLTPRQLHLLQAALPARYSFQAMRRPGRKPQGLTNLPAPSPLPTP